MEQNSSLLPNSLRKLRHYRQRYCHAARCGLGYPASESEAKKAMDVTLRWEKDSCLWSRYKVKTFGIVQGASVNVSDVKAQYWLLLFLWWIRYWWTVSGEPEELMYELTYEVLDALPKQAPKYMMGVGDPVQLLNSLVWYRHVWLCSANKTCKHGWVYSWQDGPQVIVRGNTSLILDP